MPKIVFWIAELSKEKFMVSMFIMNHTVHYVLHIKTSHYLATSLMIWESPVKYCLNRHGGG